MIKKLKHLKWYKIIKNSGLFDTKYYLFTYPDIREQDIDPIKHYVKYGMDEGRNPSIDFDTKFYIENNIDIDINKINPFVHYILHGKKENRYIRNVAVANRNQSYTNAYLENVYSKTNLTNDKKKIIIISHDAHPYGAQHLALNIVKRLINDFNYEVEVILVGNGALEYEFKKLCVVHHIYKFNNDEKNDILDSLKEQGYKNVIANTSVVGNIVEKFAVRGFDVTSLIHEMSSTVKKMNLMSSLEKIAIHSKKIIFPTVIVQKDILQLLPMSANKIDILPQGLFRENDYKYQKEEARITLCKELGISDSSYIVMNVAYGDERKGLDLFCKMATILIEKLNNIHFVWIGGYNDLLMQEIEKNIIKDKHKSNIHFLGYKSGINHYYAGSNLFFLSSREDPFPSVILDAMNCGLPVVGFSNSGGFEELINNDILLLEKNDIKKSANRLFELIHNENIIKIGNNNQKLIEINFSFHKYIYNLLYSLDKNIQKVSAIVPCYNHASFIKERLESIINQSYPVYEIIFLDDMSTDDSVNIAENVLRGSSIPYRIIVNKENSGSPFKQWMKGIEITEGKIVWIAEGDDSCNKSFLSILLPYFNDPLINIASSKVEMIDENGKLNKKAFDVYLNNTCPNKFSENYIKTGSKEINEQLGAVNTLINASGLLIRKSSFGSTLDEAQSFKMCGDWLIYLECLKNGKIAYDTRAINYFRRHSTSQVAKTEGSELYFREREEISKFVFSNFAVTEELRLKSFSSVEQEWERFKYKHLNTRLDELYNKDYLIKIANTNNKQELPNLAVVVSDLSPGGGQLFGIRLANAWKKMGGNIVLLNVDKHPENAAVLRQIDKSVPLFYTENIILNEIIEIFNIDVIHSSIWWADKYVHENFKQIPSSVKWILTMHGCYESLIEHCECDKTFLNYVPEMLKEVDAWVYTAEKNKQIFDVFHEPSNVVKVLNGYEPEEPKKIERNSLNIDEDSFIICLASRAIESKGWYEAVEAVNNLNNSGYKVDLLLIGEGIACDELRKQKQKKYIHFIGQVSNLADFINISDIGILPTTFIGESMPLILIEFMAQAKPIISTNIGEIKEMIIDDKGTGGIVLELENGKIELNKLEDSIITLLNNKDAYYNLSKNSKRLFDKFRMSNMIGKYKDIYTINHNKMLIILSTQRSGSTMLCDDIGGTGLLGLPSEYFIKPIENLTNNVDNSVLQKSFYDALEMGKTQNQICSVKIMSNQLQLIGKILQKIGFSKDSNIMNCFYTFFKKANFIILYRNDKIAQAVSRIVARQTNIYHLSDKSSTMKGLGLVAEKRDESNLNYSKLEIDLEINKIYQEEKLLETFLENYSIGYTKLYYEDIVINRDYVFNIASDFNINEIQISDRRLKKISGNISKEWIAKYKKEIIL